MRELFALSSDYDSSDKATQMFFADVQNKLLYATTKQTAAELISQRANAEKSNMGLTSWKGSVVRKQDIYTAKNRLDTNMDFWRKNAESIIQNNDFQLLQATGTISHKQMEKLALGEYQKFNQRRKIYDAQEADRQDEKELQALEARIKGTSIDLP